MKNVNKLSLITASTLAGAALPLFAAAQNAEQPNVIYIMVDDYGWADTGYNGSKFYETPNIDRLAKRGVEFTDGYAAAPISSPTRVSLMTGKYPARNGITDWIPGYQYNLNEEQRSKYKMVVPEIPLDMPLEEVTIAEAFKEGGYNTFHLGKWHCAEHEPYYPHHQGFDVNIGGWLKGSPNGVTRGRGGQGAYTSPYNNPYITDGPDGEFLTDRLGLEASDIIKGSGDDPFFMYLAFYAVHTPIEAKPEVVEYFKEKASKMSIDELEAMDKLSTLYQYQDRMAWHWKERVIQNNAEYAALIYTMDQNVGRVLDALEAAGKDSNTIVCLMGDNGGLSTAEGSPTCNAPLRAGKGWLYEGGIRVPFLISCPDLIKADQVSSMPVVSVDFYPTLLDLCNIPLKPEQHKDGVSIAPALRGEDQDRGDLFFHYPHYGGKGDAPAGAIRSGKYKLIEFYEDGHLELYDLEKDLSESTNIVKDEPKVAADLYSRLEKWRKDVGAKMPRINPGYKR
ncbi:MAG: sulfatase [Rikenellaceae bacterium]